MKENLKYLGVLLLLIGVCILSYYFFSGSSSNALLVASAIFLVLGPIVYGVLAAQNKD